MNFAFAVRWYRISYTVTEQNYITDYHNLAPKSVLPHLKCTLLLSECQVSLEDPEFLAHLGIS